MKDPQARVRMPVGQERVKLLYEEYVHYSWLKQVWDEPLTDRPELEPCCAAAFHGIELAFLLMAEFITDQRTYVAKRPRIEAMAQDIRSQMQLLAEIVDGELEEDGQSQWASLTQDFPFEGCPPTTTAPARSPGLARLIDAVKTVKGVISAGELNSVVKVVLQVTSAFQAAFQRWTVGLGIEHHFNELLQVLGLKLRVAERENNLDYMSMFRPQVVEATLIHETYDNNEDFFFRTIHLGTECWMFVANNRVRSAAAYAHKGDWHIASARIMQAVRILHYLGDHIMALTRMNLRDYLQLKVQLEGTSGAGSSQVRAIRNLVMTLIQPLEDQAKILGSDSSHDSVECQDDMVLHGVMNIYIKCDKHSGLYNYAKALEDIESALLGGFYYKHYCLAANVIGSEARGTMRRAVAGLKSGYEKSLFPVLDTARCALGARYDEELSHLKGKMMDEILERFLNTSGQDTRKPSLSSVLARHTQEISAATTICPFLPMAPGCPFALSTSAHPDSPSQSSPLIPTSPKAVQLSKLSDMAFTNSLSITTVHELACPVAEPSVQLTQQQGSVIATSGTSVEQQPNRPAVATPEQIVEERNSDVDSTKLEEARQWLYSTEQVPTSYKEWLDGHGVTPSIMPLPFLDHAWGSIAPRVLEAGLASLARCGVMGNAAWDDVFGRLMPQVSQHVLELLGLPSQDGAGGTVHWSHNSHELVWRAVSCMMEERSADDRLVILTSDTEFYSMTRQLNRIMAQHKTPQHTPMLNIHVEVVEAEPADTFCERLRYAVHDKKPNMVYCSQITYLTQQTLIPDIPSLVTHLAEIMAGNDESAHTNRHPPIIIVDAYHGFCAVPTDLKAMLTSRPIASGAVAVGYLAGLLKHAGCGPNAAFLVTSPTWAPKPMLTGWLADVSVLDAKSSGIGLGSAVGFTPGLELQGGTPSYLLPLYCFEHLMACWRQAVTHAGDKQENGHGAVVPVQYCVNASIKVADVHKHVMRLQTMFVAGLERMEHKAAVGTCTPPALAVNRLLNWFATPSEHRSHTLVFGFDNAMQAAQAVEHLAKAGVAIDSRKGCVRVGFGFNHGDEDVERLLKACQT